jgi:thiol-disulfide isomerase/thioredoxin
MIKLLALAACFAFMLPLGRLAAAQAAGLDALTHATSWMNGKVGPGDLRGKVVLVDFYTFDCINCKHTEPNLRNLYQTTSRRDLVIVGVHSPETSTERNRDNLLASLKDQGIVWPVAVDNDFSVWNSYGIAAWPTQLIFDRHGRLRSTVVGEGQDDAINRAVKQLVAER